MNAVEKFMIKDKVVIITGGAGLLGRKHAEAVIEGEGIAVLIDVCESAIQNAKTELLNKYGKAGKVEGYVADITSRSEVEKVIEEIKNKYSHIDVLINNAANNPKVEGKAQNMKAIQFENFPLEMWENDIAVGLTGALICSQVCGQEMVKQKKGVILNISSDLGVIAPDQRIYRREGLREDEQTIKPVTYSVIKHGVIGLSKYLATYYAEKGIRVNALCPAGVYNGQNEEFLEKLTNLIPMGRMANVEEYKSTILYLISEASSYMTGSVIVVDGGRTCW